jgi:hypothetical protein
MSFCFVLSGPTNAPQLESPSNLSQLCIISGILLSLFMNGFVTILCATCVTPSAQVTSCRCPTSVVLPRTEVMNVWKQIAEENYRLSQQLMLR